MNQFASSAKSSICIQAVAETEARSSRPYLYMWETPRGAHAHPHALQLKHEERHCGKPIFIYVRLKETDEQAVEGLDVTTVGFYRR